jgi:two-component system CheB/CheR fusion protein
MAVVIVQPASVRADDVGLAPLLEEQNGAAPVVTVTDGARVEPGRVYVLPPNTEVALLKGVFHVMGAVDGRNGVPLPVDYFMRALAEDQGPRAIGVILEGSGGDGGFGLKAIKEAGGITFAQDPTTARYDSMPRLAHEGGWADFTLEPAAIAQEIINVCKHPYLARARAIARPFPEKVGKLVVLIRAAFGNDLSYYKPTTVDRRVERRMALHKVDELDEYIKFVQSTPRELRLLYKDMLIGVTSFFRYPETFAALARTVFPGLVDGKRPGSRIRIWVPACATGEEAYSLAISLMEFLGDRANDYRIQIFGTDVDEDSINRARRGLYPENISLDVSPERLSRFFVKKESGYQVTRAVRDTVVFSTQNITKDAPFSRLDLVSCRNLLIYLRPDVQRTVLGIIHYALLPTGFLMLGTSETVGDASELFSLVDRKSKIYSKRLLAPAAALEAAGFNPQPLNAPPSAPSRPISPAGRWASLAETKILELYGPPGVFINDDLEIMYIRGRTGPYLEPSPGAPSFNLLRMVRSDLHLDLRRALHDARAQGTKVAIDSQITDQGTARKVRIEIIPVTDPDNKQRCWLVLFHEPPATPVIDVEPKVELTSASAEDERQQELERELLVTKEYLQSTIEELESSNEELKSSNEELQSANEELQSTNEELETSKEELQSANEELTTVNDELQNRMVELQQINDDLDNILGGIGNAIIIVGMDLRIRRYTRTAERLLNLVPSDVGRAVNQLNAFVTGLRVEDMVNLVIDRLMPVKQEVLCADQRWYELYISPYRTVDHAIKGAVLVLADIDLQKRTQGQGH